jgi:DNA polymerase III epsilon subunit-like protein
LEGDFPLLGTYRAYVQPIDRYGNRYAIDPFFTKLTGITEENIQAEGIPLQDALARLDNFSGGARFWSWGKDELNMLAISCYIAGIQPSIPARRFDNAVRLVIAAGMPIEDIGKTRSNTLADYYGVEHPPLQGHDALGDALSVAYALQHLLRIGKLQSGTFDGP